MVNSISFEILVRQIVGFNRAWKRAKEKYGESHPFTMAARDRKSAIQAKLLRDYYGQVWLESHKVAGKEELYSVRLGQSVRLANGELKKDGEHLPVRIANEILTAEELIRFTSNPNSGG